MSSKKIKPLAALAALLLAISLLAGCGASSIDGSQTAATVNGEAMSLGVVSFESHFEAAMIYSYYGQYISAYGYFDTVVDEETGKTYGEETVSTLAEQIEEDMVIAQHAADYGVTLTDEEKAEIERVAQTFVDANDAKVLSSIGVRKEDAVTSMTLDTIRAHMMEALAEEVDTEVSDEEAQQTSVTYIYVNAATEDQEATDDQEAMTVDEQNAKIEAELAEILTLLEASNIADADMKAIAQSVNEDYTAISTYFSTNDADQTTVDSVIAETVAGMEDGTLCEEILKSSDGSRYFIVRLDKTFDEEKTELRKETIVSDRKTAHFNETVESWVSASEIVENADVLSKIKLTDSNPFTMKASESEATE